LEERGERDLARTPKNGKIDAYWLKKKIKWTLQFSPCQKQEKRRFGPRNRGGGLTLTHNDVRGGRGEQCEERFALGGWSHAKTRAGCLDKKVSRLW